MLPVRGSQLQLADEAREAPVGLGQRGEQVAVYRTVQLGRRRAGPEIQCLEARPGELEQQGRFARMA